MTLSKARSGLLQRLHQRKQREREGCFVVEGIRSTHEALAAGMAVRFAVMSPRLAELDEDGALAELLGHARVDIVAIDDVALAELSGTVSPQGVVLVCEEPRAELADLVAARGGILVADAVQDPANLGSMIRTADALGLAGLIALDGTVDPWSAKVVRGGAGAGFRLPIVQARCSDFIDWVGASGVRLLAADGAGVDATTVDKAVPWVLAVGNEGAGLRPELLEAAVVTIGIPMHAHAESLNAGVAASILCYELTRGVAP
jgi:TrmH family RNA methyltransferase